MQEEVLAKDHLHIQVPYTSIITAAFTRKRASTFRSLPLLQEKEKDITKFTGGSADITVDHIASDKTVDLAVIDTHQQGDWAAPAQTMCANC